MQSLISRNDTDMSLHRYFKSRNIYYRYVITTTIIDVINHIQLLLIIGTNMQYPE